MEVFLIDIIYFIVIDFIYKYSVKICIWLQWIKLVFFCSNRFFPMGIPNKRNILLLSIVVYIICIIQIF